jgi:hypothetical protein
MFPARMLMLRKTSTGGSSSTGFVEAAAAERKQWIDTLSCQLLLEGAGIENVFIRTPLFNDRTGPFQPLNLYGSNGLQTILSV